MNYVILEADIRWKEVLSETLHYLEVVIKVFQVILVRGERG